MSTHYTEKYVKNLEHENYELRVEVERLVDILVKLTEEKRERKQEAWHLMTVLGPVTYYGNPIESCA